MPRLKRIELDTAKFVITPLTTEQVEKYASSDDSKFGRLMLSAYTVIADSLGNVPEKLPSGWAEEGYSKWPLELDPAVLRCQLDTVTINWLFTSILEFTGLQVVEKVTEPVPEGEAPGELKAVS
jgi:hypothetical protein